MPKFKEATTHKIRCYFMGTSNGGTTLSAATDDYNDLLTVSDTTDPELVITGGQSATVPEGTTIDAIDLNVVIKGTSAHVYEVSLFKNKNGSFSTFTPAANAFGSGDMTPNNMAFRKGMLSYNPIYISSAADSKVRGMNISRSSFMRNRKLDEDDKLTLLVQNPLPSTSIDWWMWGSITVHY